jgi:hypothetical protein
MTLCSLNLAWWFWPGSEILLLKFSLLCRVFNKHNWSASLANVAIVLVLMVTVLGECSGHWALEGILQYSRVYFSFHIKAKLRLELWDG